MNRNVLWMLWWMAGWLGYGCRPDTTRPDNRSLSYNKPLFYIEFLCWDADYLTANDVLFCSKIYLETRQERIGNTIWEVPVHLTSTDDSYERGLIRTTVYSELFQDSLGAVTAFGRISVLIAAHAVVSGKKIAISGQSRRETFTYKAVYDSNRHIVGYTVQPLNPEWRSTHTGDTLALGVYDGLETDSGSLGDEDDSEVYMTYQVRKGSWLHTLVKI